MKHRRRVLAIVALALVLVTCAAAVGCEYYVDGIDVSGMKPITLSTYAFFDCETYVCVYVDDDGRERLNEVWSDEILPMLAATEQSLSAYTDGAIARFNAAAAGETVEIDKCAYDTLTLCKEVWAQTDGAFNPATALSLDLWGFTDRFLSGAYVPEREYDREDPHAELPDARYVEAFAQLATHFGDVVLQEDDGVYYATKPSDAAVKVDGVTYAMQVELGGIGKGVAADEAARILKSAGFDFGYVSVGGSSLVMLANAARMQSGREGLFDVSVIDPFDRGGYYYRNYCRDVSVSTSGNYRNNYTLDGVVYSHIIAEDGVPYRTGVVTASIFGASAALCDAYTTAMCVMGLERAIEFADSLDGYEYVLIDVGGGEPTVWSNADGELLRDYAEGTS